MAKSFWSGEESKISNTEWGLVIGALAVIDLIQLLLDVAFGIGIIVNRFVDIAVGFFFGLYLQLRGQSLANPKRFMGLLASFVGEEVPVVDALPLWTLDGFFNMSLAKAEEAISVVSPEAAEALKKVASVNPKPSNVVQGDFR